MTRTVATIAAALALTVLALLAAWAVQYAVAGGQCPGGTVVYVKDEHQCAGRSQWDGQP